MMRLAPLGLKVGVGIIAAVTMTALVALVWTPHDPTGIDIARRLLAPGGAHLLGTDAFGRDVLSMLMAGAQVSLAAAFVAVGVGAGIGVPLGLWAAAAGGWLDDATMRLSDLVFAFPALVVAILLTAVLGPGLWVAVLAVGIFNIPVFARLTRSAALEQWPRGHVLAARMAGKSRARISVEHVLPNIAGLLAVQATIQLALGILAEAGLSYVGLGAQPPTASWGRMLADAQTFAGQAPWLALAPGLAIMVTVIGINMAGDGLRDWMDPRRVAGNAHAL
jgi:peptide/nickel transport system permease protein